MVLALSLSPPAYLGPNSEQQLRQLAFQPLSAQQRATIAQHLWQNDPFTYVRCLQHFPLTPQHQQAIIHHLLHVCLFGTGTHERYQRISRIFGNCLGASVPLEHIERSQEEYDAILQAILIYRAELAANYLQQLPVEHQEPRLRCAPLLAQHHPNILVHLVRSWHISDHNFLGQLVLISLQSLHQASSRQQDLKRFLESLPYFWCKEQQARTYIAHVVAQQFPMLFTKHFMVFRITDLDLLVQLAQEAVKACASPDLSAFPQHNALLNNLSKFPLHHEGDVQVLHTIKACSQRQPSCDQEQTSNSCQQIYILHLIAYLKTCKESQPRLTQLAAYLAEHEPVLFTCFLQTPHCFYPHLAPNEVQAHRRALATTLAHRHPYHFMTVATCYTPEASQIFDIEEFSALFVHAAILCPKRAIDAFSNLRLKSSESIKLLLALAEKIPEDIAKKFFFLCPRKEEMRLQLITKLIEIVPETVARYIQNFHLKDKELLEIFVLVAKTSPKSAKDHIKQFAFPYLEQHPELYPCVRDALDEPWYLELFQQVITYRDQGLFADTPHTQWIYEVIRDPHIACFYQQNQHKRQPIVCLFIAIQLLLKYKTSGLKILHGLIRRAITFEDPTLHSSSENTLSLVTELCHQLCDKIATHRDAQKAACILKTLHTIVNMSPTLDKHQWGLFAALNATGHFSKAPKQKKGNPSSEPTRAQGFQKMLEWCQCVQAMIVAEQTRCLEQADPFQRAPCRHDHAMIVAAITSTCQRVFSLANTRNSVDQYAAHILTLPHHEALFIYATHLKQGHELTTFNDLKQFVSALLAGEYPKKRYLPTSSRHLQYLATHAPDVYAKWHINHEKSLHLPLQATSESLQEETGDLLKIFQEKICTDNHVAQKDAAYLWQYLEHEDQGAEILLQIEGELLQTSDPQLRSLLEIQKACINLTLSTDTNLQEQIVALEALCPLMQPCEAFHVFRQDIEGLLRGIKEAPKQSKTSHLGWKVLDTDDVWKLFYAPTEVGGSCQQVDSFVKYSRCLLAYSMDGKNRLLVVIDAAGKMKARAILRLLWDQTRHRPVVFLETLYPFTRKPEWTAAILDMAKTRAADLGVDLVATDLPDPALDDLQKYQGHIVSKGSVACFEYTDSGRGVTQGTFDIRFFYCLNEDPTS